MIDQFLLALVEIFLKFIVVIKYLIFLLPCSLVSLLQKARNFLRCE